MNRKHLRYLSPNFVAQCPLPCRPEDVRIGLNLFGPEVVPDIRCLFILFSREKRSNPGFLGKWPFKMEVDCSEPGYY